jgi:hypothetical protein
MLGIERSINKEGEFNFTDEKEYINDALKYFVDNKSEMEDEFYKEVTKKISKGRWV